MPMMPSRTARMRKDQAIPLKSQDRNESTALARHGSNDGTASSQSAPSFSRWHGFIAKHETSRSENATEDSAVGFIQGTCARTFFNQTLQSADVGAAPP